MDYNTKFEFEKEFKENLNFDNILNDPFLPGNRKKAEKRRKDIIPLPKTKTFVEASFSQLHELTSMLGKFKHSMSEDQNNKGLVKVYYEENPPHLSMHTLGGFRYFAHTQIPILAIFPIQDGVIVKCRYDDRLIKVSFNRMANSPSYAYLTLTKHPLEDLHPLSIRNTSLEETRDMINCNQDLLFISDKLPIAIFFDEDTSHLAFNIIRNTKRNPDQTETLKEDMNDKKESEFDIFFQKRRHKLLAQISDYKEIVLYPIGSDRLKEGIKPDHFEIIDSIEDNIFFILAHITELQQVRFYRCQIIDEKKIFSIKLIAYKSKCVKMESFEFLKQENLSLPQICSSPQFTRNPEAEKFKKIMKREFNKEAIILDTEGNLKIYKGDCPLLTLSASNEIPNFLDMKIPEGGVITNISNPQKSRLTFHFEQESFRVDFQFKGKLRDYNLLSCLHVMHKILPLQVF